MATRNKNQKDEAVKAEAQVTEAQTDTTATATAEDAPKVEKVEKAGKPKHPFIDSKDPELYPLRKLPDDYQFGVHDYLRKGDFKDEGGYLEYRIAEVSRTLEKLQKQYEAFKATGGKGGKLVTNFQRTLNRLAEMKAEMEAAGFSAEEIANLLKAGNADKVLDS